MGCSWDQGKLTLLSLIIGVILGITSGLEDGDIVEVKLKDKYISPEKSEVYVNAFCMKPGTRCDKGEALEGPTFAPTPMQCQARCIRAKGCATFHFSKEKFCSMRNARCTLDELVEDSSFTTFHRLANDESCPDDRPLYKGDPDKFSKRFCTMRKKQCKGHNLYPVPLSIRPFMKCLEKCTRINACSSVDFVDDKCIINDYHCKDEELDDAGSKDLNFMRLEYSVDRCPSNREPPPTEPPIEAPTQGPAPSPPFSCPKNPCPCNSARNEGGECSCLPGFEYYRDQCVLACQAGAKRQLDGFCACEADHDVIGRECLPVCPKDTSRAGRACVGM